MTLQISELRSEVTTLKSDISKLSEVILDNPEKVLSVPLLRKDMSSLKESYRDDLAGIRQEVYRVYDLNKWFIGLMFTMAIGLFGLAISNLFQSRRK